VLIDVATEYVDRPAQHGLNVELEIYLTLITNISANNEWFLDINLLIDHAKDSDIHIEVIDVRHTSS